MSEAIAGEALSDIEQGNAGSQYKQPDYAPSVPKMMQRAWHYLAIVDHVSTVEHDRLRELARAVSGYGRVAASAGDVARGVEAERACIGIGQHLIADWPLHDRFFDVLDALIGIAITSSGYSSLQQLEKSAGDQSGEQEAAAEYAAFQAKMKVYLAALDQTWQDEIPRLYDGY